MSSGLNVWAGSGRRFPQCSAAWATWSCQPWIVITFPVRKTPVPFMWPREMKQKNATFLCCWIFPRGFCTLSTSSTVECAFSRYYCNSINYLLSFSLLPLKAQEPLSRKELVLPVRPSWKKDLFFACSLFTPCHNFLQNLSPPPPCVSGWWN